MASPKTILLNAVRKFGYELTRLPGEDQESRITGSFPPRDEWSIVGKPENYFIHDGYQHRDAPHYFNDTANTDVWQREVYRLAREVFDTHGLSDVCDIGCGSGFKLIKYFGQTRTLGLDVAETCAYLRRTYPDREWLELDLAAPVDNRPDLVIASDVIEHLMDPDQLLSYIRTLNPRFAVISTPDRNLLRTGTHNGPPHNPAHIREWSFAEFDRYIGSHFTILEHFISNAAQRTQCILCAVRPGPSST